MRGQTDLTIMKKGVNGLKIKEEIGTKYASKLLNDRYW